MMSNVLYITIVATLSIERIWETFFCWRKLPGVIYEEWTLFCLAALHVLVYLSSIIEHFLSHQPYSFKLSLLGLCLFLIGSIGRIWASRTLGEFHSAHIEIRKNHTLISNGLYALTQHPYYLSVALEMIGFPLFVQTPFTLIIVLFCYLPMLYCRLIKEDQWMQKHFGTKYENYKKTLMISFGDLPKGHL